RLVAGPVESEVANGSAPQMRVDPKGENALGRRAELSCAGEHATTCDPYREIECSAVFEGHDFRGQLGGAVEGNRRSGGKVHSDAVHAQPAGQRCAWVNGKGSVVHAQRNEGKSGNRVNAAAAKQQKPGLVL